jgi:riboflavin kinase
LLKLIELGALRSEIHVSTTTLAQKVGVSQQTASRYIIALLRHQLIDRRVSSRGSAIQITARGQRYLEPVYLLLKHAFEGEPSLLRFEGMLITGLGEGGYYVRLPEYRHQFIEKLGFDPYPGTLNIQLSWKDRNIQRTLESTSQPILIKGFTRRGRTFGDVKCFHALINEEVRGAVIVIHRTHHDDRIIELIAPRDLRSQLGLVEGSQVKVEVTISQ